MNTGNILSARILEEFKEISITVKRAETAFKKAVDKNDDLYLDSVALNLHSFYSGIEKIFKIIAKEIDGSFPDKSNWHEELLIQMSLNIPNIRPPVISDKLKNDLQDYRSFRHLIRNIYTYNVNPEKIKPLVQKLPLLTENIEKELKLFTEFLQGNNTK
ncbi:MAG: ribonuclease toxin HepT-like protein [bacterium]|jgi:hypothetical protein|uniref:HepT-like domain-containing protein n=1 Tax=Candidatus Acididesulfobacter diazotrophicus TaxID=2597226 RepID=A0A519BNW2_9DELT|nr:MAG: hypothetical protein EVG15_03885 [Candidatus Acididesulfobacter diazotrophicus]